MNYQRLRLQIEDRVAHLTLITPERGNRVDHRLLLELEDAAEAMSRHPTVCVILVSAEGPDFCLGWDNATRQALLAKPEIDPFRHLAGLSCITVAAMQGRAFSAGLELALACDIRIASEGAHFAIPEISEGLMPLAGATQRLPRIAGRATALSMLLLAEEIDARRAYQRGLVSRVFAPEICSREAAALATTIASRGPLALRYAKEAVHAGLEQPLGQALRFEADLSVILQSTTDRAEGLQAFFEKRPPRFDGR